MEKRWEMENVPFFAGEMENVPFSAGEGPMRTRTYWFEDLAAGTVLEFGSVEMTEEEIVGFARRYDPQPFPKNHRPP